MAAVRYLNLFPFCPLTEPDEVLEGLDGALSVDDVWPVELTLEEAMAFWWRVRAYKAGMSFDGINHNDSGVSGGISININILSDGVTSLYGGGEIREQASELDLITIGGFNSEFIPNNAFFGGLVTSAPLETQVNVITPPTDEYTLSGERIITVNYGLRFGGENLSKSFLRVGKDAYRIAFHFFGGIDSGAATAVYFDSGEFFRDERTFDSLRHTDGVGPNIPLPGLNECIFIAPITNRVIEYPLYITASNSIAQTTGFAFRWEPQEYYPYDPGDGLGPIYNRDTGNQIRRLVGAF
jgi:hypothetical protein